MKIWLLRSLCKALKTDGKVILTIKTMAMEKHIGQVLKQILPEDKTPLESIVKEWDTYSDIELTDLEYYSALLEWKKKKYAIIQEQKIKEREAQNRRLFIETKWSPETTEGYIRYRATLIFEKEYLVDEHNKKIFNLLCSYFSSHESFLSLANEMGVLNPSLKKGLFIAGGIGVGKTWMMKLFSKNQRQVYTIKSAKSIADSFISEGGKSIYKLVECPLLPFNDKENFCQEKMGLCIDDVGAEEMGSHFKNTKNVLGDLIELRYTEGNTGPLFHMTTNLTMIQVKEFYGDRVGSRLRESMNIIQLKGVDRRK